MPTGQPRFFFDENTIAVARRHHILLDAGSLTTWQLLVSLVTGWPRIDVLDQEPGPWLKTLRGRRIADLPRSV